MFKMDATEIIKYAQAQTTLISQKEKNYQSVTNGKL